MTRYLSAANEIKQSAVLSPVLFSVYLDDLLIALSSDVCFHGIVVA